MKSNRENIRIAVDAIVSFMTAFVLIMICSKSSLLYPLNDWVDANTYHTVGRGMLHGKVPYRDLYEQKGPLLYLLHAAAAAVAESSFLGVFIIEAIAAGAFFLTAARLLRSVAGDATICLIPLMGAAIYSSDSFCHGDSAEELCLPLTLAAYVLGRQAAIDGSPLSDRKKLALGALAGTVIWIKYTFLGVFAASFIADIVVTFRKRGGMSAVRGGALYILGCGAVSLPILLYFGANGAVDDLFRVYFYDNIFRYPSEGSFFRHLTDGWNFTRIFLAVPFYLFCAALVIMPFRSGIKGTVYYAGSVLLMSLTVFGGHSSYQYYPLAMAVYLPEALCVLSGAAAPVFRRLRLKKSLPLSAAVAAASLAASCGISYGMSRNVYLMKYSRDELPQYKFAEIINDRGGSLLNYGFIDGGFYLAAGQVPEFRYFCMNNMSVPEMKNAQDHYIASGKPTFIVTRSESPTPPESFAGYDLVSTAGLSYYNKYQYYFLFEINETQKIYK